MTGRLHLIYGLAGAGKTTVAKQLANQTGAIRFTLDEWMLRLFPELTFGHPDYPERAAVLRELFWELAAPALRSGLDVVLDWNAWSRQRRAWAVTRARTVDAEVLLHRLSTSIDDATLAAERRARDPDALAHRIDRAGIEHLATLLEEPDPGEGLIIIEH